MTGRRRRDGDPDPVDGRAQAVGPRSSRAPQARPRRDAADGDDGAAAPDGAAPRVRGAWSTPAVVVRGPDGQIVDDDARARPGAGRRGSPSSGRGPGGPGGPGGPSGPGGSGGPDIPAGRRRPRPRRIPGAPGSVLLRPTLLADAADGREVRRRRRQDAPVASVTPLPPRPPVDSAVADAAADDGDGDDGPALLPVAGGDVPAAGAAAAATTRRGPGSRASRRASAGRGSRGPSPAHPGEPRRQRVLQALAALDRGRGPVDDEAAERWAARRQRIGSGLTAAAVGLLVVLVIYVVFPVRAALDQRAAAERARERLEVFERENALLEAEARELRDDDYIEELAREMGLVLPGEESYGILPAPREPAAPDDGSTSTTRPGG